MPHNYKKSVWGIYPSRVAVETVIDRFREAGFLSSDVSVLLPENLGPKELTTEKSTKAPEGVAAGASSGVLIGGALGWLAGIGALAIPGLGPFIAAGPAHGYARWTRCGRGCRRDHGYPNRRRHSSEYEAKRYEGRLAKGGILVSVHCDKSEAVTQAKDLMERTGGEEISVSTEEANQTFRASG